MEFKVGDLVKCNCGCGQKDMIITAIADYDNISIKNLNLPEEEDPQVFTSKTLTNLGPSTLLERVLYGIEN